MNLKSDLHKLLQFIKEERVILVTLILFYLILMVVLPRDASLDITYWKTWSSFAFRHGVLAAYQDLKDLQQVNYLPLTIYILQGWGWLMVHFNLDLNGQIYLFKLIPLLFDFASLFAVVAILREFKIDRLKVLLIGLNIAFLYNSLIWEQVDSMFTFFCLLTILSALKNKPGLSLWFYLIAFNFKIQSLVFLPLVAILLAPQFYKNPRTFVKTIVAGVITQVIIFWPFISTNSLGLIWHVITASVDFYPRISFNAFNLWTAIYSRERLASNDNLTLVILSFKQWGLLIYTLAAAFLSLVYIYSRKKISDPRTKLLVASVFASLLAMTFFLFNTEMHERYVHPALIFAAIFAIVSDNYLFYILLSIAYFLNLNWVQGYFAFQFAPLIGRLIASPRLISLLFLFTYFLGIYNLIMQLPGKNLTTKLAALLTWLKNLPSNLLKFLNHAA